MSEDNPEPNYRGYEITGPDPDGNFYIKGVDGSFKDERAAKDEVEGAAVILTSARGF